MTRYDVSMAVPVYQELDVTRHRGKGPSPWHSATELPRVLLEISTLASLWPLLGSAPRGDGHPVLVLPGFTAGDESTVVLRRFLSRLGYEPLPWELGQNTGSYEIQEQLVRRFYTLTQTTGQKVSIIGQSLGGVYARELAHQFAPFVRQIITLGSPFSSSGPETTNALVGRLFRYMSGMNHDEMRDQMLRFPKRPPPVPCSAIYSKSDGVVHWSACLEFRGEQSENIEIVGSHSGMAVNPVVFHAVADRLAQPEGTWRPFRRDQGWRSLVYPTPEQKAPDDQGCGAKQTREHSCAS